MRKSIQSFLSILVFFLIIGYARKLGKVGIINFYNLPDIKKVFQLMYHELSTKTLISNILFSLSRIYIAFAISSLSGIMLGIITARFKIIQVTIYPILELLRPIPNAAWLPFAILLFASTDISILFIIIVSSFFPIYINTLYGVKNIQETYLNVAKTLNLSKKEILFDIIFQAALPSIFTGLHLGMSGAWLGLIVAEMSSGKIGLGYYIWINYTLMDINRVVVGIIIIAILGIISNLVLQLISKRYIFWCNK